MYIDDEKRPEYSFGSVTSNNIIITSRYNKIQELALMLHIADRLNRFEKPLVKEIWCDSKASSYTVTCYEYVSHQKMFRLGRAIDKILCDISGGHSGIAVENGINDDRIDVDPNWEEAYQPDSMN